MTNDHHLRTNQSMRIGEIMPLCLKNMKQQIAIYKAKNRSIAGSNSSIATKEATPRKPVPSSCNWFMGLLFVVILVLAIMPKSFWGALWQYITQARAERKPPMAKSTTESPKPTNSPYDATE